MTKSIFITGCSTGIGYMAAKQLKATGFQVFASARKPDDITRLQSEGFNCLNCDLNDSGSIERAVANCLSQTDGQLDVLINNAAYGQFGALEDLSRDTLRAQFETNLFGLHELTTRLLPALRKSPDARIINISSVLGFVSMPLRGAYNASKYALEGWSDTLRLELHSHGIPVVLIEPGPIVSEFRNNAYEQFVNRVEYQNSHYLAQYEKRARQAKSDEPPPFSLGPEAVVAKILKAIQSRHPKPRYFVTFPTYLFAVLKRTCSTRVLDRVLRKS